MSLIAHLQQIPEFRAARGQRHELWFVLLLMILGAMMGYWGYRPLAEFVEIYGKEVCQTLGLAPDTKLPSYSTFRRVMQQLDYQVLATAFTDWAQRQHEIEPGEWFACDGKGIKGSVTDADQAQQNFVSMVSLFSYERGVVQAVMPMEQKLVSEQEVVRLLLSAVGLRGIGVTLDALHTQKKRCTKLLSKAMITSCVSKPIKSDCIEALSNKPRPINRSAGIKNTSKVMDAARTGM